MSLVGCTCPGCGQPNIAPELCAACRAKQATAGREAQPEAPPVKQTKGPARRRGKGKTRAGRKREPKIRAVVVANYGKMLSWIFGMEEENPEFDQRAIAAVLQKALFYLDCPWDDVMVFSADHQPAFNNWTEEGARSIHVCLKELILAAERDGRAVCVGPEQASWDGLNELLKRHKLPQINPPGASYYNELGDTWVGRVVDAQALPFLTLG